MHNFNYEICNIMTLQLYMKIHAQKSPLLHCICFSYQDYFLRTHPFPSQYIFRKCLPNECSYKIALLGG